MRDPIERQDVFDLLNSVSPYIDSWLIQYIDDAISSIPFAQPEQRVEELLPDGTLHLFTDTDLSKVNRVWVSQNNTHYGDLYYADEDPKTGKWLPETEDWRNQIIWVECSECGFNASTSYNFCPNCGVKMSGVEQE